jgi:hypothetical protein
MWIWQSRVQYKEKFATKLQLASAKSWWKIVKEALPSSKGTAIPSLQSNGTVVQDPQAKAEALAKAFAEFSNLDDDGREVPKFSDRTDTVLERVNFSAPKILRILQHLDVTKATGPDNIPNVVLKSCSAELAGPLSLLFRLCFCSGTFPRTWKSAHVIPTLKPEGDPTSVGSYRPISLLSCVGKVYESVSNKTLHQYLESNDLLGDRQNGFRRKHSTVDCLVDQYQEWIELLAMGYDIRLLSFDIAKAFDRVWHRGLLKKLYVYGVRGCLLKVIESFLSDRSLRVVLDGFISREYPVKAGVPQGSVLGPTLFLIYINDMGDNLANPLHHFADDTTTHSAVPKHEDPTQASLSLQMDLLKIEKWSDAWMINFNASKTKELLITRSKVPREHPSFIFKNEAIKRVDELRLLGIHFSTDLSWNNHLDRVRTSCARKLGVTLRCKNLLPSSSIIPLYKSCIRPIAEYGCPLFAGAPKTLLAPLQKIQNRANRAGCASTQELLQPLNERFDVASMAVFYKYMNSPPSDELSRIVPPFVQPTRQTRRHTARSNYLKEDTPKTEYLRNSFIRRCTSIWNDLPGDIIPANPSVDTFKRRFNRHLKPRGH